MDIKGQICCDRLNLDQFDRIPVSCFRFNYRDNRQAFDKLAELSVL